MLGSFIVNYRLCCWFFFGRMSNNPSILLTNISTFLLGTHPILPRFFHAPWFCLREFQGNRRTKVLTHAKAATPQTYLVNFLYNNWSWLITQLYLILGTTILDYTYILRWNAVPLLRWSSRTLQSGSLFPPRVGARSVPTSLAARTLRRKTATWMQMSGGLPSLLLKMAHLVCWFTYWKRWFSCSLC